MPYKNIEDRKEYLRNYRILKGKETDAKRKQVIENMTEEEKSSFIEKRRQISLKSYYKNRESILKKRKETSHITNLKYNYGLTLEEYNVILKKQNYKCAICECNEYENRWTNKNNNLPFVVDHCHTTGIIRGLLCDNCNLMVGHAKNNIETLKKAINYLE